MKEYSDNCSKCIHSMFFGFGHVPEYICLLSHKEVSDVLICNRFEKTLNESEINVRLTRCCGTCNNAKSTLNPYTGRRFLDCTITGERISNSGICDDFDDYDGKDEIFMRLLCHDCEHFKVTRDRYGIIKSKCFVESEYFTGATLRLKKDCEYYIKKEEGQ